MQSICIDARNNKIVFRSYFIHKMAIICYFEQFISCFGIDFDKTIKISEIKWYFCTYTIKNKLWEKTSIDLKSY